MTRHFRLFLAIAITVSTVGCQSASRQHVTAKSHYDSGDAKRAIAALNAAEKSTERRLRKPEQDVIRVDRALAHLMDGNPSLCEAELRSARKRLDFLQQKDLREETSAVLTDDRAVAWSGFGFERRMIDNILTLSSLLGDRQDAFAHAEIALQNADDDLTALLPDPAANRTVLVGHSQDASPPHAPGRLRANAFAAWLHAAVHSERALDARLTDHSLKQVSYWRGKPSANETAATLGTRSQQGHGVLNVITFVGRATEWKSEAAEPTSAALLLADQILSSTSKHTLPPTIAAVKIARPSATMCSDPFRTYAQLGNAAKTMATSSILIDLNEAAWDTWQHNRDQQLARAVVRRVIKKGAIYAAKDQAGASGNAGVDLLLSAGGVAWEALEKADTRHLTLLPARIEIAQIELPAGTHEGFLRAKDTRNTQASAQSEGPSFRVDIQDGANTFLLAYRHSGQFTKIVTEQ